MASPKKKETKVEIFGRSYTILGDAEEEYTTQLACYVDQKMRELADKTSTVSSLNLAILVALNISDELFSLREQIKSQHNLLEEKLTQILTKLEEIFIS
jgi:cell division protein ZapA